MKETILLIVDMQRNPGKEDVNYDKILGYVIKSRRKYDLIMATALQPLGESTQFEKYSSGVEIIEDTSLEFRYDLKLVKNQFGLNSYKSLPITSHIDIIGRDTDNSVSKIAYDLFDRRYDFSVLSEYCYSLNGESFHRKALEILRRNLGSAIL